MKLTKNRLDKNTLHMLHKAKVKMVDGKAKLISSNPNFGKDSGFYFVTDSNRQCMYINYVGDDIGTENRGFGHVVSSINRQRSKQMEELHGLLENKRVFNVNYIPVHESFKMLIEFAESQFCKELKEEHAYWMRQTIERLEKDTLYNHFRPMKLIMEDIWL